MWALVGQQVNLGVVQVSVYTHKLSRGPISEANQNKCWYIAFRCKNIILHKVSRKCFSGSNGGCGLLFFYKIDANLGLSGGAGFMAEIMYTLHNI